MCSFYGRAEYVRAGVRHERRHATLAGVFICRDDESRQLVVGEGACTLPVRQAIKPALLQHETIAFGANEPPERCSAMGTRLPAVDKVQLAQAIGAQQASRYVTDDAPGSPREFLKNVPSGFQRQPGAARRCCTQVASAQVAYR